MVLTTPLQLRHKIDWEAFPGSVTRHNIPISVVPQCSQRGSALPRRSSFLVSLMSSCPWDKDQKNARSQHALVV